MEEVVKRLHVTIPVGLFNVIYKNKDMNRIDSIIANLLSDYYGVDLNGNKRR